MLYLKAFAPTRKVLNFPIDDKVCVNLVALGGNIFYFAGEIKIIFFIKTLPSWISAENDINYHRFPPNLPQNCGIWKCCCQINSDFRYKLKTYLVLHMGFHLLIVDSFAGQKKIHCLYQGLGTCGRSLLYLGLKEWKERNSGRFSFEISFLLLERKYNPWHYY